MSAKEEFQARRKQCRYSGTVYTLLMFLFIAGIAIAKAEPYDLQSCSFLGGNKWERVQSVFVDARSLGQLHLALETLIDHQMLYGFCLYFKPEIIFFTQNLGWA